ncbi:MAG: ABC transporter substrate-binding protein [Candidatus Bipolaricaulia bacterium]
MRFARISLLFILVGLLASLALAQAFPLTVVDDRGQEIIIPARPERIVAIGALYIEILLDIGAGDRLVGVADSPDNPPEVADLPRVGPALSPSVEAILALEPDLVLGAWGAVRDKLEELKVTVLTTGFIAGLPDIFATIRTVGKAVGDLEEAEALIGKIAEEVILIESKVLGREPVRAAFLYMMAPDTPPYAAGSGSIENELLFRAGGANVFAAIGGFPQVGLEELLVRDPQVIFTDPAQVENFYQSRLLGGITAVRERRVYGIKASAVTSTRVAQALRTIAELLHPEAFGE